MSGYQGLVNEGATCYLNSLLQTLYMTYEFRSNVYAYQYFVPYLVMILKKLPKRIAFPINYRSCSLISKPKTNRALPKTCLRVFSGMMLTHFSSTTFNNFVVSSLRLLKRLIKTRYGSRNSSAEL